MRTCRVCKQEKELELFQKDSRRKDGRTLRCKDCAAKYSNQWHHNNRDRHNKYLSDRWYVQKEKHPEKHLWWLAKRRAKEDGTPFSITPQDIPVPESCPVLNKPLKFKKGGYSPYCPSVDRTIPELGYVPGNVVVMSHKANTMKSNATLAELKDLVRYLESVDSVVNLTTS